MTEKDLLDEINIKTFPEIIINYLKTQNVKTNINNLRSFYSVILSSINENIKDSYLNRILKYLSSKEESTILIFDDIASGIYKNEILNAFKIICLEINKASKHTLFYKKFIDACKFIYFDSDELEDIKDNFINNNYEMELYLLFLHTCKYYKTNTPNILAERLLYESYPLYASNKMKYILLKASADLGNDLACLFYANSITNINEQVNYFIKGKNLPQNLWELAFLIEHYSINNILYNNITKELKDIINEGSKFIEDNIIVTDTENDFEIDCTILALNIYLYIANVKKLSKAYNSIGKFFLFGKTSIMDEKKNIDKEKTEKIAMEYSIKAMRLSNIHAMQNIATYFYENKRNTDFDIKKLLKIGADAKDVLSSIYFTKILLDENRTDDAEEYLKYIANNNKPEAQYQLAKIYENKLQIDDAINYYEKAINNKYYIASLNLAKIYFNKYMSEITSTNKKKSYLILAINLIESYYDKYDLETKKEAKFLLANMKNLIDE